MTNSARKFGIWNVEKILVEAVIGFVRTVGCGTNFCFSFQQSLGLNINYVTFGFDFFRRSRKEISDFFGRISAEQRKDFFGVFSLRDRPQITLR
jgi:hypothetical protein